MKHIFFFLLVLALAAGCKQEPTSSPSTATNTPEATQRIENDLFVRAHEGHEYVGRSHLGLVHSQSCPHANCKRYAGSCAPQSYTEVLVSECPTGSAGLSPALKKTDSLGLYLVGDVLVPATVTMRFKGTRVDPSTLKIVLQR